MKLKHAKEQQEQYENLSYLRGFSRLDLERQKEKLIFAFNLNTKKKRT